MPQSEYLIEVANDAIEARVPAFDMLLPHYADSVREDIDRERDELRLWSDHLQRSWEGLVSRCQSAMSPEPLVQEMRKVRVRALQFNRTLRSQKQLLKVEALRQRIKADLTGLSSEAAALRISDSARVIDDMKQVSEGLQGQFTKPITRSEEARLFLDSVLVPIESRKTRNIFSGVGKIFAKSMKMFVAASTRRIYREQWRMILVVIWRVLQPAIVPIVVTILVGLLVAVLEETLRIEVRHLELWALLAFVALVLAEQAIERIFEEWHLKRYRRTVELTALSVYASEIRARAALIGLVTLAEAEPVAPNVAQGATA